MASLILQDGTILKGEPFGAKVDSDGEVVFNTGMAGYPESMTDPSYRGQILVTTFPLIGNYGVPGEDVNEWGFSRDFESEEIHVKGLVVLQVSDTHSHHLAASSIQNWMEHHNVPGITGIDTRMLTKHLREKGVMLGRIIQDDSAAVSDERLAMSAIDDPNIRNLVAEVSIDAPVTYDPPAHVEKTGLTILAYDCGMKRNIIRSFLNRGVRVVRVPWNFDRTSYDGQVDGVFISNGPGDPKTCAPTIDAIRQSIGANIPTFGICLGNQLMGLAIGGDTYKLPYGHRGANQPCVEVSTLDGASIDPRHQRCIITSQNHGFALGDQLPKDWNVWWRNANDQTVEGIRHTSGKFFAVQFHPEAAPGPEDANYLFDEFVAVMRQQ
ncbi:MAG TPA: glutamine-hydrolyzing carbamoyl-phosphate synthase small subunit [Candidatus Peribacteraceae bacterium]|nr:glutamine-hydrolyzing carbamoyl-phosphate synthase small subunit [Candidatus Peribacteraceae bacterium]